LHGGGKVERGSPDSSSGKKENERSLSRTEKVELRSGKRIGEESQEAKGGPKGGEGKKARAS